MRPPAPFTGKRTFFRTPLYEQDVQQWEERQLQPRYDVLNLRPEEEEREERAIVEKIEQQKARVRARLKKQP